MAKPIRTPAEAMETVVSMAKHGHLIQQLSPYHFRICYGRDLWVDWWPTTGAVRIVIEQCGRPLFNERDLASLLEGFHYATFGTRPIPVLDSPRQPQRDPAERPQTPERAGAGDPVPEGQKGQADLRDEGPPWAV